MIRRSKNTRLMVESLESRRLLAGDCSVELDDGELEIECDKADNRFSVEEIAGDLIVQGTDGTTTVNGVPLLNLGPVDLEDLEIETGKGDDQLDISGITMSGDLEIETGQGSDRVRMAFADIVIGGDVDIETGQDDDTVLIAAGFIGPVVVDIGGDLEIETGRGNDIVLLASANFVFSAPAELNVGGDLEVELGQGDDIVEILDDDSSFNGNATILGDVSISAGPGDDDVALRPAFFGTFDIYGDLEIDGGPGDNSLILVGVNVLGDTDISNF